jgi:DNA (cytosine-5)-methyltransferase 1
MWREMARIIYEVRPKFVFVENSPMLTSRGLGRVLGDLASMGFDARWGVLGAADVGANHQRDRIWIVAKWRGQLSHAQHERIGRWEQQQEGFEEAPRDLANTEKLLRNGGNDNARISMERKTQSEFGNDSRSTVMAYTNISDGEGNQCTQRTQSQYANPDGTSELAHAQNEGNVWREWQLGFAQQKHHQGRSATNGRREWWQTEPNVGRVADGVAARVDRLKAIGNGQVPLCAATAWQLLSD